ncbi:MAG: hypothetical protein ABI237_05920 [Ginsengibacter sp.]
MNENLIYILSGTGGVLLQVIIKITSLKKQSAAANMQFVFKKYLADDWLTILGSFVTVGLFAMFLPEIVAINPVALKFARIGFAFIGFTGSSIAQSLFSATSKKILSVIDIKTNIADDVEPPVTPENVGGLHEAEKGDTTNK